MAQYYDDDENLMADAVTKEPVAWRNGNEPQDGTMVELLLTSGREVVAYWHADEDWSKTGWRDQLGHPARGEDEDVLRWRPWRSPLATPPRAPEGDRGEAPAVTEAKVELAAREYLLHRGEKPFQVDRYGVALWEVHAPAMRAALVAALRKGGGT